MIPILVRIRSRSPREFGDLVRHQGEEFLYVLEGRVAVHSEFYDPVVLEAGQGIYIDSTMGHAYLAAEGCEEALALAVCSSADENLQESLISLHN
jgi:mannose-6-phosphate isomerase-like protein (cupin superfamily)